MAPRLAQSRAEIVEQLYKDLGLSKSVHFVHSPPLHSILFGLAWNYLSIHITLSVLSLVLPGTVCPSISHYQSSLWSCLDLHQSSLVFAWKCLSIYITLSVFSLVFAWNCLSIHTCPLCPFATSPLPFGLAWNCIHLPWNCLSVYISLLIGLAQNCVYVSLLWSHLELSVHLLLGLAWNYLSIFFWVLPGTICPSSVGLAWNCLSIFCWVSLLPETVCPFALWSHSCLKLSVHLLFGLA